MAEGNLVAFSPLSIWECRIKESKGRLTFAGDFLAVIRSKDFVELKFTSVPANAAGLLPTLHSDSFDQGLVAQARTEDHVLFTNDPILAKYVVRVVLV